MQTLVDCLVNWQQVTLAYLLSRTLSVKVGVLHLEVVSNTGLAEGHLVRHAKSIDHLIVLIAVEHTSLLHLGHHLLRGLVEVVLLSHLLCVVHVLWQVWMVKAWLTLTTPIPNLSVSTSLVHIVTHLKSISISC